MLIFIVAIALVILVHKSGTKDSCLVDSDCVPEQCCHPYSCVNINHEPDCTDIACTEVCSGPIDCGAGSCKCVNNRCEVVPSE